VILGTISQPIGSAVAIAGAYLLIKHQKIGLFISMTSVPILLINNRWLNFITIEGLTLIPVTLALGIKQVSRGSLEYFTIYYTWFGIYNGCTVAIAALNAICWKVVRRNPRRL
jgi:hypothetical protein